MSLEQGSINVLQNKFSSVSLSGCYFQLWQSIYRQLRVKQILKLKKNLLSSALLQSFENQNQSQTEPAFAHDIHKLAASAFLNLDSMVTGFKLLCEESDEQYNNILDYFEETYIGMSLIDYVKQFAYDLLLGKLQSTRVHGQPLSDIRFCGMHGRTTQLSVRTNGPTEEYDRHIDSIFQCSHLTLWFSPRKLLDEEKIMHADLIQINAGKPPKKKKINQPLEKRLINLLNSIHDGSQCNSIRSLTILISISKYKNRDCFLNNFAQEHN